MIKSFPYRIVKNLVLQNIDLTTTTVAALKSLVKQEIATKPGWKVYKLVNLDTMKLYTHAHGSKTTNLIINLDHADWILQDDELLSDRIMHESEISFFNNTDYNDFITNPTEKW